MRFRLTLSCIALSIVSACSGPADALDQAVATREGMGSYQTQSRVMNRDWCLVAVDNYRKLQSSLQAVSTPTQREKAALHINASLVSYCGDNPSMKKFLFNYDTTTLVQARKQKYSSAILQAASFP
jgi:hypothetical protein